MYLLTSLLITAVGYGSAVNVAVQQGMLQGAVRTSVTNKTFYAFKGIPYAAPPIGDLRFREPQPPLSWKGTRNATEHGNVCPQVDIFTSEYIPGDEDCLFINVYTPTLKPTSPMPVMFFIHGGGFRSGSGNDDNFGPDFFMDELFVLATINYRLDFLGFGSIDSAEMPGNAGLKDQVAALKWVQANIANFGGDPSQVTILGQSAGSTSCTLHALSPMSKGLFNRSIGMSGTPISDFANNFEAKRRVFKLGALSGFETSNATELVTFLKSVPVKNLVNTSPTILGEENVISNIIKFYHFVPVVEKDFGQERFLIETPQESVINGRSNDVTQILGYVNAEAVTALALIENSLISTYNRYPECLVPTKLIRQSNPPLVLNLTDSIKDHYFGSLTISLSTIVEFVQYITDTFIYYDISYAKALSDVAVDSKVYIYEFTCQSERNIYSNKGAKYNITGAGHIDDLFYLFQPYKYNLTVNTNSTSYKMIKQTITLFTNFAKYGNPTPDSSLGVTWLPYDASAQNYLDIGEELKADTEPQASMMEFWQNIHDQAGLSF